MVPHDGGMSVVPTCAPATSPAGGRPRWRWTVLTLVVLGAALGGFTAGRLWPTAVRTAAGPVADSSSSRDDRDLPRPLALSTSQLPPPALPDPTLSRVPSFEASAGADDEEPTALDEFFRRAVQGEDDRVGSAYAGAAAHLTAEEVRVALDAVGQWPAGPRRAAAESLLLRRWGQLDPTAALAWAASVAEPLRRHELRRQAMLGWASVRPAEALAYIESNSDGTPAAHRLRDVFEGAMNAETGTALEFVRQLDPKRFASEAGAIVWSAFGRDPAATLAVVEALPDGELRRLAVDRVIDHWARYDPWAARLWMERIASPDQLVSARIELGESWARVDPAGAVNWFLDLPPEEQNGRILDRILYRWMQYDPEGCTEWLRAQPPAPMLDRVRAERAVALARRNVEEAIEWMRTIADGRRRAATEEQIVWDWYRRDRAGAVDYVVHRSALPDAARQRVIERARRDAERDAARQ